MRYAALLDPLSDEEPCGPDLEDTGDDDFIDYYYEAMARIPERFINTATGEIFDRKTLDLSGEVSQINALLDRTRDIRLLVLEAKFQALAGKLQGFADCVEVIAKLLQERWTDVHPQVGDGNVTERKNQLELLDDRSSVVMPLEYCRLVRDRRLDEITYRGYQIASGAKTPREDEKPLDAGSISAALRSADNADAVAETHATLLTIQSSLSTISTCCKMADGAAFAPALSNLEGLVNELVEFIGAARPDLEADEVGDGEESDTEAGEDGEITETTEVVVRVVQGEVKHHAAAAAALLAVESYFHRHEPSTPGLLLIRQARKLVGRPLTEAIDTLLPSVADNAVIDFGTETGFKMDIYKLRELADDTYDVDSLYHDDEEVPEFTAPTRTDALHRISTVESFFRQVEPSRPVPVLLFKAKNYVNRDFSAIVSELFANNE